MSQCQNIVTHTVGTQIIGCTKITVSSSGFVDTLSTYCNATMPYVIGYKRSAASSADGSYTFIFSPPVPAVTLNFSGISTFMGGGEEIRLKINGNYYPIPNIGTPNGCDALAILTPAGNIAACSNCNVSGWNGTTITGNINSITVLDTVLNGQPAGALFSLFVCDNPILTTRTIASDTTVCKDNNLILDASRLGGTYLWQNGSVSPVFTTKDEGKYWVKTDINNCSRTDSINVRVIDCVFEIPNIFTPNEDGLNDAWHFEIKNATNVRYSIYNRWGNLMKDSDLPNHTFVQWDGRTTAGESCPAGVYYFVLSYTDSKGEAQKKNGYITLIK